MFYFEHELVNYKAFYLLWSIKRKQYVYQIIICCINVPDFYTHSQVDCHLGCSLYFQAFVNRVAINIDKQVSL